MTEIISRLFIKNHNDYENESVRKSYGALASVVGVITNLLLALFKFIVGFLATSVAITADAVNNLSDAGTSVITFVSFKLSSKPADKDHPFGHARLEYISSMIVSFLIMHVGLDLLIDSGSIILGLKDAETVDVGIFTIVVLSVSILLKLWLGFFYNKIGKKIDSGVVRASAMDSLSDSVSTFAVLVGAIIIKLTDFYLIDAIIGIAVSCLILYAGLKIMLETKDAILGEKPVEEVVSGIEEIISEYEEILGTHDLMVHNYGPKRFIASLHAEVDGCKDIYLLHDMIDNAEKQIKDQLGILCTIHMDPIVTDDEQVNELKHFLSSVLEENALDVTFHDFRTVIGKSHTNMIFDVVLPFDYKYSENEIIEIISNKVAEKRENCFCVITVDRG